MPGSSNSILIRCDDEKLYVVSFLTTSLANNLVGYELGCSLALAIGLPVLQAQHIWIAPQLMSAHEVALDGKECPCRASSGVYLGTRLPGDLSGPSRMFEYLPERQVFRVANRSVFLGMYIFDLWAGLQGRRRVFFAKSSESDQLTAYFVGDGNLFDLTTMDHPRRNEWPAKYPPLLFPSEVWTSKDIVSWIGLMQAVIPQTLSSALLEIPEIGSERVPKRLQAVLLQRLRDLPLLIEARAATGMFPFATISDDTRGIAN